MADSDHQGIATQNANAPVQVFYVQRTMKVYGINEHETQSLSSLNAQATTFFSLGSSFIGVGLGIWMNVVFATQLTPSGQVAQTVAAPALIIAAVAFFWLAWKAVQSR